MKIVDCEQGTPAWLDARRGIPTASRFCDIVTPTGKPVTGKARRTYMLELVGERLSGLTMTHFVTDAMQRGTDLEPKARAWYELTTGRSVTLVGFVLGSGGRWGASPDGVTDVGGIEIKCPGRVALLDMVDSGEVAPDYRVQLQGEMWVCGRSTWDFVLYTDEAGMPCVVWPQVRDEKLHAAFDEHIPAFCDELDAVTARLRKAGAA